MSFAPAAGSGSPTCGSTRPSSTQRARGLAGRIACVADARPIDDVRAILERAGLTVTHVERHDHALLDTIDQVVTRLRAFRLLDLPLLRSFDLAHGVDLAQRAADTVARGDAGYTLLTATKP